MDQAHGFLDIAALYHGVKHISSWEAEELYVGL